MEYNYFIAGDINPDALILLIQAQVLLSDFEYLNSGASTLDGVDGFSVTVGFAVELSTDAKTALDGVISAYALIAPLALAKAAQLANIQADINNFIESHYSFLVRSQLFNLYVLAKFDSLTNRAAYIRPGINWLNSILAYSLTLLNAVNAMTDVATIEAFTWNIASHVTADPAITLGGALVIVT